MFDDIFFFTYSWSLTQTTSDIQLPNMYGAEDSWDFFYHVFGVSNRRPVTEVRSGRSHIHKLSTLNIFRVYRGEYCDGRCSKLTNPSSKTSLVRSFSPPARAAYLALRNHVPINIEIIHLFQILQLDGMLQNHDTRAVQTLSILKILIWIAPESHVSGPYGIIPSSP